MDKPNPLEGYVAPMPAHVVTPEMLRRPKTEPELAERRERYKKLAERIRQWAEDREYNERVGTLLERELNEERYGRRQADDPAA